MLFDTWRAAREHIRVIELAALILLYISNMSIYSPKIIIIKFFLMLIGLNIIVNSVITEILKYLQFLRTANIRQTSDLTWRKSVECDIPTFSIFIVTNNNNCELQHSTKLYHRDKPTLLFKPRLKNVRLAWIINKFEEKIIQSNYAKMSTIENYTITTIEYINKSTSS